jgi:hypothetical protein
MRYVFRLLCVVCTMFALALPALAPLPQAYDAPPPLLQAYEETRADFLEDPTDIGARLDYGSATFDLAEFFMFESGAERNEKFPVATRLYREVLWFQPFHAAANERYNLLIGIYNEMGLEVPD